MDKIRRLPKNLLTSVFSAYFCIDGHAWRHCEERSSLDMKFTALDCFVVPPRNDAKRQRSPESKKERL